MKIIRRKDNAIPSRRDLGCKRTLIRREKGGREKKNGIRIFDYAVGSPGAVISATADDNVNYDREDAARSTDDDEFEAHYSRDESSQSDPRSGSCALLPRLLRQARSTDTVIGKWHNLKSSRLIK